jgi:hypothetical protein
MNHLHKRHGQDQFFFSKLVHIELRLIDGFRGSVIGLSEKIKTLLQNTKEFS